MKNIKTDEMNLYDYVIESFDRICDLTEGRFAFLNMILTNASGKFVNVGLFKSFFGVNNFEEIVALLTDMDRLEEMRAFGLLCRKEVEKEQVNISTVNVGLVKKC